MKLKFTFLGLFFFVLFQANDLFKTLQNKPMKNASSLVVFYRPDCPYCMKLDEEIGKNADLSDEIKSKFNVSVIDITTKEGRKIAAYYGVNRVPAIIKYDSKNEQFENIIGFQKSNVLRNLLFNNKKSIKISKNLTTTSICGNGIIESGESCDDGNMVNGDGCSNTCSVEAVCGNGIVESGETCDDGNTVNGDGCSYTCKVEIAVCGNGMVESGESCDDGNMVNGDGCNNTCTVQSGWSCTGNPSVCSNTLGVDEISSQGVFNLIVAPNPVVDKLHVQFFLPKKSNVEITVIDISGKQVFQSKLSNLIIGLNEIDLPFKNKLSSGTYILKIKFANEVLTKKLMVK